MWASFVLAILNLAVSLAEYLSAQRLMKAGENEALIRALENANARITKALDARRAVSDSLPESDPYRRD